ncbi:hypothetical protein IC762_29375 [Bradyrhizobium genosp. L]|uniref:hypothetical protein n=1 Tax=Bradyrhizobium genosp. L TaxID=83637 RepID=UPI0018A33A84|nr:hypothetical protein [Bradyrhizobium genosp. L]QPF83768.1 hypothetical protein IC762_29375 [Bradyrhizobium genosp. L]
MTTVSYYIANVKSEFDGSINANVFQGSEVAPSLATLGDGSIALGYGYYPASFETILNSIFVNRFNSDGSQAAGYGGSDISSYSFNPALLSLPGTNNYIAVWMSDLSGSYTGFGIYTPSGTGSAGYDHVFSKEGILPVATGSNSSDRLAALPGNKLAVLTAEDGPAQISIVGYDSAYNFSLVTHWQVGDGAGYIDPTSLNFAVLSGGNIVTTFTESNQNGAHNAFMEIDTASGARVLAPTALNNLGGLSNSNIVALKDGGFAIAYVQPASGSAANLHLAFYTATGALRGDQTVGTVYTSNHIDPALSLLSNGFLDLTWVSSTLAGTRDANDNISAAIFDPTAMTKVAGADLETQDGTQYQPAVTALAGGQFATAWTDLNTAIADGNTDPGGSHIGMQIDGLVRETIGTNGVNETLRGDSLSDVFTGGHGPDTFVFSPGSSADTILDFTHGEDRIYLANFFSLHSFNDVLNNTHPGSPATLTLGADSLTLYNVDKTTLTAADFILARQKADFDGNAHSDLLWQNDNGMVSIWNNGQINQAHVIASAGSIPSGYHIAGSGDFDGNGQSDILWHNDNGTVSIWDNGAMASAHVVAGAGVVAPSWSIVGTGDFDGNSRTDILWQNTNGSVSIWNNGDINGARVIAGAGTVDSSWHIAGVGDFDGNGQSDILWRNDNGMVSIWDNGDISKAHVIAAAGVVASSWHIAGVGDFDGNTQSDILWQNDNGSVSIWDNGAIASAHVVAAAGVVDGSWHIAGTGDFDGNGHSDIVWRNDNGSASIWDNGNIANAHVIAAAGTVDPGWHIV